MPGDVLIEATFGNPYTDPSLNWEHGFFFGVGASNHFYKVSLESDGDWERYAKLGSGNYINVTGTPSRTLRTAPGEENLLQVVLARGTAFIYINRAFAGSFLMDTDTGGDRVDLFIYDEHAGSTNFEQFTVWEWHPSMYRDFPEADPANAPTPTPTATPRPTATPTPEEWWASGYWYRDPLWEESLRENDGGNASQFRVATLDPYETSDNGVFLTLACVKQIPIAYISPQTLVVPNWMSVAAVGIWDEKNEGFLSDPLAYYLDPRITDDGSSVFIFLRTQVNELAGVLRFAHKNQSANLTVAAGMISLEDNGPDGYWGEFDVAGLEDALSYLGCYGGVR